MPTTLYVDPQRACVYVHVAGSLADEAYVVAFKAIVSHPQRAPHFAEVWDLLDITRFNITPQLITTYTTLLVTHQKVLTRGRIAILTRQEDVQAMTMLSDQLASRYVDRPMRLFRDARQAEAWLDLPADAFARIKRDSRAQIVGRLGEGDASMRRAG